jgi:hypothetical protein
MRLTSQRRNVLIAALLGAEIECLAPYGFMNGRCRGDISSAGRVLFELPAQRNLICGTLRAAVIRAWIYQFSESLEDDADDATQQRYDHHQAKEPKDNAEHRLI